MDRSARVAELYREWGPFIHRRCRRLLGNDEEAEDALQEVFVRVLRSIERYEEQGKILNFLYRVTTNHCLNQLRARKNRPEMFATTDREVAPASDPSAAAAGRELLTGIFEHLDEDARTVLYLRKVDGLTVQEVADVVGFSRKTVGRRLKEYEGQLEELKKRFAP